MLAGHPEIEIFASGYLRYLIPLKVKYELSDEYTNSSLVLL